MSSPSFSSIGQSTTCSSQGISQLPSLQTSSNVNEQETVQIMDIFCEEQSKNRRFSFPQQRVVLENDSTMINLKKTFEQCEALKIILTDTVIFRFDENQTQVFVGVYDNLQVEQDQGSPLILPLTEQIRIQNQIHLSFYRKKEDKQKVITYTSTDGALNKKRKLDDLPKIPLPYAVNDNSQAGSKNSMASNSQHSQQAVQGELTRKKKKLNIQGNYLTFYSDQEGSQQNNSQELKLDFEEASSEQKESFSNKSNKIQKEDDKANQKKSQERTIKDALEMVSRWRDLQDFYKQNNITKDYQSVADEIGISKKTLDYYYLELRTAEYFGFNFDANLDKKMGILREYIQESKKNYQNQFSTHKIPRNQNLKYRIPQQFDCLNSDDQQQQNQHQQESPQQDQSKVKLQSQFSQQQQQQQSQQLQSNTTGNNYNNTNTNPNPNPIAQNLYLYNSNTNSNMQLSNTYNNSKNLYDQPIVLSQSSATFPQQSSQKPLQRENSTLSYNGSNSTNTTNTMIQNSIINHQASNGNSFGGICQTNSGITHFNPSNGYHDQQQQQQQQQQQYSSHIPSQQPNTSNPQTLFQNSDIYQNLLQSQQNEFPLHQRRISLQFQEQSVDYNNHTTNQASSSSYQEPFIQFGNSNGNQLGNNFRNHSNPTINNNNMHPCQQQMVNAYI